MAGETTHLQGAPRFSSGVAPGRVGAVWLLCVALGIFASGCSRSLEDRIADGRAQLDAGQVSDAIGTLRGALELDPDSAEANQLLGAALLQAGQPGAAVFPLQKAADKELPQKNTAASMLLAKAYLQLPKYEDALRALDAILETDPEQTAALRLRVETRLRAGQAEQALADAQRLVVLSPDDVAAASLNAATLAGAGRTEQAEKEYTRAEQLGDKSGDAQLAAQGCFGHAKFLVDQKRDGAAAKLEQCVAAHPADSLGLQYAAGYFNRTEQPARATAIWKRAVEQSPENLAFRLALAQQLRRTGDEAGALAGLRDAANSFGIPAAWSALAQFQKAGGDLQGAEQSLTKAVEAAGPANAGPLRFALAALYVDMKQLDKAEETAAKLDSDAERALVHGQVLLEKGDAAGALAAFDTGIRAFPNNAAARYLAGVAASRAGDPARAEQEYREALRADARGSDAALALAQIALDYNNPQQAVQFAQSFLATRDGRRAEALRILARAQAASHDVAGARSTLEALAKLPGEGAHAATDRAFIEAAAGDPRTAVRIIEESHLDLTDPAAEPALRILAENLIADGRGDQAVARVDAALARHPESAALYELRGAVLSRMGRTDDARAAFEKSLSLDPKRANALFGLGTLALGAGDLPKAFSYFDQASKAAPGNTAAAYAAAQVTLALGNQDEAMQRLREIVSKDGTHAGSRNDLAFLLASKGQELDLALELAQQAKHLGPSPDVEDTLGWVRLQRGEALAAIAAFEQALVGRPKDPTIRYHLGLALARKGDKDQARSALQQALDSGNFPEADAARQELARLGSK